MANADEATQGPVEAAEGPKAAKPKKGPPKRPKSEKYRGLLRRSKTRNKRTIYFERKLEGQPRIRVSCKTDDWVEAAAYRDAWLEKHKGGTVRPSDIPTFAALAQLVLEQASGHLAPNTLQDRKYILGEKGPLLPMLGQKRIDDIEPEDLEAWWSKEIDGKQRSTKTGKIYLDTASAVFDFAKGRKRKFISANPVDGFREVLAKRAKTQRGRAESEAGRDICPINAAALRALLESAEGQGRDVLLAVLLGLDAG